MKKGLSLHIGVRNTNPDSYGYTRYGPLCGCVNDATAMRYIATHNGYHVLGMLTDETATFHAVEAHIRHAICELQAGETFLLTFSGHGAQLPTNEVGENGSDEGFVLYDFVLKDDYIDVFLRSFRPKVRVIIVADSCHSGTIYNYANTSVPNPFYLNYIPRNPCQANKKLPNNVVSDHVKQFRADYQNLNNRFEKLGKQVHESIEADVVVLSACMDNELAADGPKHGVFTEGMLAVLKGLDMPGGKPFDGTYKEFTEKIHHRVGNEQYPQTHPLGPNAHIDHYPFFEGPPFTLNR